MIIKTPPHNKKMPKCCNVPVTAHKKMNKAGAKYKISALLKYPHMADPNPGDKQFSAKIKRRTNVDFMRKN